MAQPDGTWVRVDHRSAYGERAGVHAFGVGSACIAGDWCGSNLAALTWWPTAMQRAHHTPRTVVAHIGINDLATGHTAEQVIAGLLQLRKEGQDLGIRVVFGTVSPAPIASLPWTATQVERLRVNNWIRSTESSYVDYARALEGPDGWLRAEFESAMHDVHINDAGAAAMAAALRQWIEQDARRWARVALDGGLARAWAP